MKNIGKHSELRNPKISTNFITEFEININCTMMMLSVIMSYINSERVGLGMLLLMILKTYQVNDK